MYVYIYPASRPEEPEAPRLTLGATALKDGSLEDVFPLQCVAFALVGRWRSHFVLRSEDGRHIVSPEAGKRPPTPRAGAEEPGPAAQPEPCTELAPQCTYRDSYNDFYMSLSICHAAKSS